MEFPEILKTIKEAVRGKDVRQAIYDGLSGMQSQVTNDSKTVEKLTGDVASIKSIFNINDCTIINGDEINITEQGLVKRSTKLHDNSYGYYCEISNTSQNLFVEFTPFVGFDDNWSNIGYIEDGKITQMYDLRMPKVVLSVPSGKTIYLCSQYDTIITTTNINNVKTVQDSIDEAIKTVNRNIDGIAESQTLINDKADAQLVFEEIPYELQSGVWNRNRSLFGKDNFDWYSHAIFTAGFNAGEAVYVTGRSNAHDGFPLVMFYDENKKLISYFWETASTIYNDKRFIVPEGTAEIVVNGYGIKNEPTIALKMKTGQLNVSDAFKTIDDLQKDEVFEYTNLKNRCLKLEQANPFQYAEMDKAYIVVTIDDCNSNLPPMYDLCHRMEIPLSPASIPSTLKNTYNSGYDYDSDTRTTVSNRTVQSILDAVVEDGGEILAHNGKVITVSSDEKRYKDIFIDCKKLLMDAGFNVRGIILSGGTDSETGETSTSQNDEINKKCQLYSSMYYDFSDLYGIAEPYRHTRLYLWDFTTTDNLISNLDNRIRNHDFIVLAMHGSADTNNVEHVSNVRKVLERIRSTFTEGTDFEFTTWSSVYDKFKSTELEERLKKLESE